MSAILPPTFRPGELRAARTWASLNGYTFAWQDDPTDALDVACTMYDNDGLDVACWIGGVAGTMTAANRTEIESQLALEHTLEAQIIPTENDQ